MAAEFVDYKRSPAFWFLFALIIGADISNDPSLSASITPLEPKEGQDMMRTIDEGLRVYESAARKFSRFR